MQKVSRVVFGVSMLLIGCAVGACVSRFVVPPANAQQQAHRWEYLCFRENVAENMQRKANVAGHEGWELVTGIGEGIGVGLCFKRPVL